MALVGSLVVFTQGALANVGMIEAHGSMKTWRIVTDTLVANGHQQSIQVVTGDKIRGYLKELCRDKSHAEISMQAGMVEYSFLVMQNTRGMWMVCAIS